MTCASGIYRLSVPEGYEWALPNGDGDYETLVTLAERPTGQPWIPIEMTLLQEDDRGRPRLRADLPWLGTHVLVLRDAAIESLADVLAPHGHLLPLSCPDARLALFSPPLVAGVLDEARSDLVRFSSGRIMDLRRPAFRFDVLGARKAFKLAEMPRGGLYLTGDLVAEIQATGKTAGTTFVLASEGPHGADMPEDD